MNKMILILLASMSFAACTSVSKTTVASKEVVQITKFNWILIGGAPAEECVKLLNDQGATTLIEGNGAATNGLFGITRFSGSLSGSEACNAVGTK